MPCRNYAALRITNSTIVSIFPSRVFESCFQLVVLISPFEHRSVLYGIDPSLCEITHWHGKSVVDSIS